MGVCNCSIFCFSLVYGHSSFAIIFMGKTELFFVSLMFRDCCVALARSGCVIVAFRDHTQFFYVSSYPETISFFSVSKKP